MINLVLNYRELNYFIKQKHFDSKIMLDKLLCIYHSFTMKLSLLQITNTKKLIKSACLSRVLVQYVNRKFLQFYKRYFTNLYQMKDWKLNIFVKF